MNLKTLIVAAAVALAPMMAWSSTLPLPSPTVNNLSDEPFFWNTAYNGGDSGETIDFIFSNDTGSDAVIAISGGTVQQFSGAFDGGVTFTWLGSGDTDSAAENTGGALDPNANQIVGPIISLVLAANATDTLRLSFGNVLGSADDVAQIDFSVVATPVPVPAGILLMGTALAGFGVMRRRKKVS